RRAANIMHRDDIGMIQSGDGASLGEVRLSILFAPDQLRMRHFDGHEPAQLLVVREIDDAEAALAKDALDDVAVDPLRQGLCQQIRWRSWLNWFRSCRDGIVHGRFSSSNLLHARREQIVTVSRTIR